MQVWVNDRQIYPRELTRVTQKQHQRQAHSQVFDLLISDSRDTLFPLTHALTFLNTPWPQPRCCSWWSGAQLPRASPGRSSCPDSRSRLE